MDKETTTREEKPLRKRTKAITSEELQRRRYGGFNFGAAFFGWPVANSVSVLLIALLSALGSTVALTASATPDSLASEAATIGLVGGILLLLVIALAYYSGGYVAGRMSRFDGGKQGLGVWILSVVITIVLALAGTILGASFNLLQQLNLPSIPVGANFTVGGLVTFLLIIIVSVAAAVAGGKVGERYHHKVDRAGDLDT